MIDVLGSDYGNPSGAHRLARTSRRLIDDARDTLAAGLGCARRDRVLRRRDRSRQSGRVRRGRSHRRHGGVQRRRAPCGAHPVEHLGGRIVAVDRLGRLDLEALADALDETVCLVSVMLANNETGVVQPLEEIAALMAELAPRAVLHTDAVQAFPWLDVASMAAPAQLISVAAHKFGGPKGVGALAVRAGTPLEPQVLGGGQERGLRSGTHNTPGTTASGDRRARRRTADRLADGAAVPDVVETRRRDSTASGAGRAATVESGKVAGSARCVSRRERGAAVRARARDHGVGGVVVFQRCAGSLPRSMGYDRALAGSSPSVTRP
jgi:cysteine desulfurase